MQARREHPNRSHQSNNNRQQRAHQNELEPSKFIKESIVSEYQEEFTRTDQRGQQLTGRRGTIYFERQRRKYKSNINITLSQFFNVKSLGIMQIFKKLFDSVEPSEILEFLGGCKTFIKMIKLLIQDESLHPDISAFDGIDFTQDFLYETVPRTFMHGLMRLKESREIQKNEGFTVTEAEVKALYMGCFLLIDMGQIHKKYKVQSSNESSEAYFHRIVTYLLDESTFLTPKLFYYISYNWVKIIKMIRDQFRTDEKKTINERNQGQNLPNINQVLNHLHIEELNDEEQSFENIQWEYKRVSDFQIKFLSESKQKYNKKTEEEIKRPNPQLQNENFKRSTPSITVKGKIETQKKVKLNCLDPVVKKAAKYYNFVQIHTRDRSKKSNNKTKRNERTSKVEIQKEQLKKQITSEEKPQIKPEIVFNNKIQEEFCYFDSDFQNFFEDKEERYSMRRQGSVSSLDEFFFQTFNSPNNNQQNIQSSEKIFFVNHHEQTESEENEMQPQEQNNGVENPNRKVRHESRQIDYMIKQIIEDRFVMIQAIANEIYHSLKAVNAKLFEENGQGFVRNLTQDFEEL